MAKQVWTATGRRKRSSASVRITGGTGNIIVNGVDVNEYFPNQISPKCAENVDSRAAKG